MTDPHILTIIGLLVSSFGLVIASSQIHKPLFAIGGFILIIGLLMQLYALVLIKRELKPHLLKENTDGKLQ